MFNLVGNNPLKKRKIKLTFLYALFRTIFFIGMAYVLLFPIIVMLSRTFRTPEDMYNPTIVWIPQHFTLDNFKEAIKVLKYGESAFLTGRISLISTLLTMASCSMCGYALGRFNLKGKSIITILLILTIVVPIQTYIISLFFRFRFFDFFGIGKILSLFGISFPEINLSVNEITYYILAATGSGIRSGLFILVFYQSFRSLPKELDDASRIDGCGEAGTFFKVMVPNAGAPYLVTFILSLVWYWNDTVYSGVFLKGKLLLAQSVGNARQMLQASNSQAFDWNSYTVVVFACALLFIIPPLIMYLFAQKFFMQSVERSGIVG